MPNLRVVSPDWHRTDLETIPPVQIPDITDLVQQTLARLMGWDENGGQFRRIAVDGSGRVLTTSGQALQGQVNYIETTAPATPAIVLPSNVNRLLYIIQNGFTSQIVIGFDSLTSTTRGIRLPVEALWMDELYRGDVWAVASSGNQSIEIAEYTLNA